MNKKATWQASFIKSHERAKLCDNSGEKETVINLVHVVLYSSQPSPRIKETFFFIIEKNLQMLV